MAVKNFSSRVKICGRGAGCHGGHSAVEQSSYISRETMYSEHDAKTYYPKYSEDLVYTETMVPDNAPATYRDPRVLWNAVEMIEKGINAQLCRTIRFELPNDWTYELAKEAVRKYCQREFVDKGMCCQFAIHDSENDEGQRNLHVHIMVTLRGIDEQGKWMPKQKKVYLTDEKGERIPLIDKATGEQKVDKQNRKQWKCKTVPTNDWNSRENAKRWRTDFVDMINAINERIGNTENFWEHRSFKEQGLEIAPQIHLGEKSAAMERAGIKTIRGNINREIISKNAIFLGAKAALEEAKENLKAIKAIPIEVVKTIKNEILDMIREVAKRNHNRLSLPIMSGKYIGLVSNRAALQDRDNMERFVQKIGVTTFEELETFKRENKEVFDELKPKRESQSERVAYLEGLLEAYAKYEPYIKYHKEQWALRGFAKKKYERQHISELSHYDVYRSELKSIIQEDDKKIMPVTWRKELEKLQKSLEDSKKPYSEAVVNLAKCDVLQHNRRDLERMLENESHQRNRDLSRNRNTGRE